ncbi:MAG: HD domain-containing protein [Deltaproteobacteria bacterium]|nr:HD domain-containing protein [Candidatus Zymogenaceae bacterium]
MTILSDHFDPTDDPLFCDLIDAVRECFVDDDSHGMNHALNTLDFALAIADGLKRREGADIDLYALAAAALMHDIGRENIFFDPGHGGRGARRADDILTRLGAPWDREKIMRLIALHDEEGIDCESEPMELIILRDADKLELLRIGPDYLDLDRLVTREALALVEEVLARYDTGDNEYRKRADETTRRAKGLLGKREHNTAP